MKRPWSTDEEELVLECRASSIGDSFGVLVRVGASEPSPTGAPQAPQKRLPPETSAPQDGQRITAPNNFPFVPPETIMISATLVSHPVRFSDFAEDFWAAEDLIRARFEKSRRPRKPDCGTWNLNGAGFA
jgi:hypothetical protein